MIRLSRRSDEAALQDLFHVAFGDPPEATRAFFSQLYRPGNAIVWVEGDAIASAMYLLDAGTVAPLRVSYSYALATLPEFRGRGLGATVTQSVISRSLELGFDCNLICPATEALFAYYTRLGYSHAFSIAEGEITCVDSSDFFIMNDITSTDFSTYLQLRAPHLPPSAVAYPEPFLRYVEACCTASGGGLYQLESQGQTGCAAVERRGDRLFIQEVLPASLAEPFSRALTAHLGAQSARFRTSPDPAAASPALRSRPFVLAAPAEDLPPTALDAYFPFVLD